MERNHTWHLITIGLLGSFAFLIMAVYYVPYLRSAVIDSLLYRSGQEASVYAPSSPQNAAAPANSSGRE